MQAGSPEPPGFDARGFRRLGLRRRDRVGLGRAGMDHGGKLGLGHDNPEILYDAAQVGTDQPKDQRRETPPFRRSHGDVLDQSFQDERESCREVGAGNGKGGGDIHDARYDTTRTDCKEDSCRRR